MMLSTLAIALIVGPVLNDRYFGSATGGVTRPSGSRIVVLRRALTELNHLNDCLLDPRSYYVATRIEKDQIERAKWRKRSGKERIG